MEIPAIKTPLKKPIMPSNPAATPKPPPKPPPKPLAYDDEEDDDDCECDVSIRKLLSKPTLKPPDDDEQIELKHRKATPAYKWCKTDAIPKATPVIVEKNIEKIFAGFQQARKKLAGLTGFIEIKIKWGK
jgi:hypothetical protein